LRARISTVAAVTVPYEKSCIWQISAGIWQWTMHCSFDITHSSERVPILQGTTIVEPGLQRVAAALLLEAASREARA
jgi:hypothetical protein